MNVSKTKEIANSAQTRDEDLHNLTMIFGGHIYFQTLYAAIKLDLFSMLADKGPMSQEEIAEALSIESKPARILLLGLSSIRLLKKTATNIPIWLFPTSFYAKNPHGT